MAQNRGIADFGQFEPQVMAGGRELRMAVGFARVEEMCFVLPNQVVVVAVDQMVLPVKPLQHGFDVCGLFGKADIAEVVHSVLRGNDAVPAVDQVFVQLVGVIALQAELRAVSGYVGMGEVPVGGEIGLRHGILGFWSSENEQQGADCFRGRLKRGWGDIVN